MFLVFWITETGYIGYSTRKYTDEKSIKDIVDILNKRHPQILHYIQDTSVNVPF